MHDYLIALCIVVLAYLLGRRHEYLCETRRQRKRLEEFRHDRDELEKESRQSL